MKLMNYIVCNSWTYEQAVKLFLDNTAFTEHEIQREICRYITWPAQVIPERAQVVVEYY